jgi:hypothetical protein
MDPARTQTSLGYFESATFAQEHVAGRDAHIFKTDLSMTVRRVIVTINVQQTLNFHSG